MGRGSADPEHRAGTRSFAACQHSAAGKSCLTLLGCVDTQATGYCKTWAGEGGADAGTVQAATDLEFFIDLATGQETVVVAEVKPVRRQARTPALQPFSC